MDYNPNYDKQQYSSNEPNRPFEKYPVGFNPNMNQPYAHPYAADMKNVNYNQQNNINNYNSMENMMSPKMPNLNLNNELNMNQMRSMNTNGNFNHNQSINQYQHGINSHIQQMYPSQSFMNNNTYRQQPFNSNNFQPPGFGQQHAPVKTAIPAMPTETAKPKVLIPNINAVKKKTSEDEDMKDKEATAVKYKKPNRIFIACTRCHKSKVRCLQLSDEEIARLPEEHIKHMVQIMGVPKNISDPFNKSINKTSIKRGINYPCKRCYKSDKICVYDHSRIGRGRKPKNSTKMIQPNMPDNFEAMPIRHMNPLPISMKNGVNSFTEASAYKYVPEVHHQPEISLDSEDKNRANLRDYHLKECMTISKTVTDNLKLQLERRFEVPIETDYERICDTLTDEEMDMKNYDFIKMGLLTEQDCEECFHLFKTELMSLPQMRRFFDILIQKDWRTFKENHPKLFYTIVSTSFLVHKSKPEEAKQLKNKGYKVNDAVLKMLLYYGVKKQVRTVEMFMCVNILVVWDNMGHMYKWKEFAELMSIFKGYLNFIIESKIDIQEFIDGNIELTLSSDMSKLGLNDISFSTTRPVKKVGPLSNVLLTEGKYLEFPCMAVILELSVFLLTDAMTRTVTDNLDVEHVNVPFGDSTIRSYSEALSNSNSIYHQNLHIMAKTTYLFMDLKESNKQFKGKCFEELRNMNYFRTMDSQVSSLNDYLYRIPADNTRLRLCLHSMKGHILEHITDSLLLSYEKVKDDPKQTEEFYDSIDDEAMNKIYEIIKYSKHCIIELEDTSDEALRVMPECYLARLIVCFEMILKLLKLGLTNTKRFEQLIIKIFEFSMNNVTTTYRFTDILKAYPSNFFLARLQHVYTHAYMVFIEHVNDGIQNDKFIIDKTDPKVNKLMKQFNACFKNNSHMKNKLEGHVDFFYKKF